MIVQKEDSIAVCTKIVYTVLGMKNITLSADESLIEQARNVAKSESKTLNAAFREWLQVYAARAGRGAAFDALMRRLGDVQPGRHFTRDEMNER